MAKQIEGIEQVNRALENVPKILIKNVKEIIRLRSIEMQSYIRTEHLTGGTSDTRLRVRSGRLRGSVIPLKVEVRNDSVDGGVSIGTKYGRPHFGPKGEKFIIRGKKGWLTIPIDKAHGGVFDEGYGGPFPSTTKAGVGRGSAMFGPWGNTFIKKTDKGNLIIFGQMKSYSRVKVGGTAVKGLSIMKLGKKIVPLFLLRKQVSIPARVDPKTILNWIAPKLIQDLKGEGIKVPK
jgi:hypothetical protein